MASTSPVRGSITIAVAPYRRVLAPHLGQDFLHARLDRGVDREPHVLARLGTRRVDDAHRLAGRVVHDPPPAVGAVERLLERLLQAGEAVVVGAHRSDELRGERPLRIGAPRLDDGADALDPELLHGLALIRVELAAQIDEAFLRVRQQRGDLLDRALERGGDPLGGPDRVVDQERVCEHGDRVLGDRELHPVAVRDRAAPGGHLEVVDLLRGRPLAELARAHAAEPGGAAGGH